MYTLDTAEDNYIKFLEESLVAERNLIFQHYWQEGFLGRALLYVIEKFIVGCVMSFRLSEHECQ